MPCSKTSFDPGSRLKNAIDSEVEHLPPFGTPEHRKADVPEVICEGVLQVGLAGSVSEDVSISVKLDSELAKVSFRNAGGALRQDASDRLARLAAFREECPPVAILAPLRGGERTNVAG